MTAYVAANVRSMVALLVSGVTMFAAVAPASARTINVNGGDDLQAAIDRADGGDTVTVKAGANFTGPFTLPVHQGRKPVTIRSSRLKKLLRGRRVRARDARFMAASAHTGARPSGAGDQPASPRLEAGRPEPGRR